MTDYVIMADTIGADSGNIPESFTKVAGYVTGGGIIAWTTEEWDRFVKTAGLVSICQDPNGDPTQAVAFDIEPGALTIADFVRMAGIREHDHKWNSAAYIEASQMGDLVQACVAAELTMVELWVANWSLNQDNAVKLLGTKMRDYEIVAVQYASPTSNPQTVCPGSHSTLKQLNLDLSVTLPTWFPPPAGSKAPTAVVEPPVTSIASLIMTVEGQSITIPISSTDGMKTWKLSLD